MTASVAIQTLPAAKDDEELVRIVDEVIAYIKSTGLNCYVGPFETTIAGHAYDQLMDIVKECQHIAIRAGAPKVSAYIKVVYEPEGEMCIRDSQNAEDDLGCHLVAEPEHQKRSDGHGGDGLGDDENGIKCPVEHLSLIHI